MANWAVTITSSGVVKDTSTLVNVTATATNSVSSEVQTRVWPIGNGYDINWYKSQAQQWIRDLNSRDANYTALQAALTAAGGTTTLATG